MHHLEFEGPTEGPTECELDDTAADIQRGGGGEGTEREEGRGTKTKEEEAQRGSH